MIDALIIGIFAHVWFLAIALYAAVMWKLKGSTIGGIVFGLQVARLDDRPVEWETAIVRALGLVLPAACVPGVAMNVRLLEDHIATLRGERR